MKTKEGEGLRPFGSLSYSTMRDLLCKKLGDLGHSLVGFRLHSFCAGGASAAAKAGVPDRLFKQHGRCKLDTVREGYVEESVENRLSLTIFLFVLLSVHVCICTCINPCAFLPRLGPIDS